MVVTCEKCHTRFLLDEDRIKGARVKARCSRCQNVFWVEGEGEPPGGEAEEQEEMAGAGARPPGRRRLEEEMEPLQALGEPEEEPEPPKAAPSPTLPKPSIFFTTPAKRSPWRWITTLLLCLLGGLLVGGVVMWFWGYTWVAHHLKFKGKPLMPLAKVTETAKVETLSPPPAPPVAAGDLKGLELINQEERYRGLVNKKGGQLLLIQGKVKNSSTHPLGPIQLKAVLIDPQHKTVSEREFYAGTVIFDDELQNLDPEEINRWLDTPGGRAQKQKLEPGETQTFMVVFFGAPKNLSGYGYRMQIIRASGASSQPRRR